MKKFLVLDTSIAVIILVVDQLVKQAIEKSNLGLHHSVLVQDTIIPGILAVTKLHNNGAAWSIMAGQQWFFYIITTLALVALGFAYYKFKNKLLFRLSLLIMIAGTLGNFIDRVRQGFVVDMFVLKFINFPVFNIADVALTVGVIGLFLSILTDKEID
ncbi:signal peptidase II [Weissella beninensis]|uniref:Lipoprotein signal peptidase n=1 Tax=Periweissella beninensis TaxID=504936 RepID=A0ABT0VGV1_9LACO|nr:signal peptidase II [Periweissella beninensis]MBM7544473.1 signal peptidase II [Periweissella beninensis]MCM2437051.1 signal peptidase II [Periweissella beninensis]